MRSPHTWIAVFTFWMLCSAAGFAQNIKGTVTDSLGQAVSYAGVNLKAGGVIVAYTTSNNKGAYTLAVPADADKNKLQVEASCVGYKKAVKPVEGFDAFYDFKLSPLLNQLKAVTVKDNRPRLRVNGDTTDYKVSDYSSPQDRVIGDVIKKLPGVNVAKDGKISYNGKEISNLYIGGDNLLDDKYNIATNSIPNGVVDKVQVMENHQPVKMLKDKVVSEDVALNLTIKKKDAKLQFVGQETVGAGLPDKFYADLNAMMFKDKYKAINYLKANNTAYDVQNDLIAHNRAGYLQRLDNDKPATVLSLGTVGDPDLPRNRYLFNQSGIINLNNLVNLKNDVQLRANLSYLRDNQRQNYSRASEFYLPNDTVRYSEVQNNRNRPDILHSQVTVNVNKTKFYLNNNFTADYSRNTGYSSLLTNGTPVNQLLKDNLTDISNEFNFMKAYSNKAVEVYSYLNRSVEPEYREIDPGLNPAIFNGGKAYAQLLQRADIPTWFTNNYIAYKFTGSVVTQSYKAGFSLQSQTLRSNLSAVQLNGTRNVVSDSAVNDLDWSRRKLYAEAAYDIPGKVLKIALALPVNLQHINYSDDFYRLNKSLERINFSPRVSVKYQTGIEDFISLAYNYRNDVGNIQDVYNGYILKNYRTLYANNADLTQRNTQNASIGYNYRKAITLFFFSVNASYTHINANNIASSILTNNLQQRIVLPYDNNLDSWAGSGYVSKYAFGLRTTFSGGITVQTTKLNQIQNNIVLPYNTVSAIVNIGAETKVSDKVNFSYKANYDQTISKSAVVESKSRIQRLLQQGTVNYNPTGSLFFSASADHYYTRQQQANDLKYIFADASMRYKFTKLKADIEMSAQNLFNTKTYSALYLSANTFTRSSYAIPGRFLLAKVTFNI